MTYCDFRVGDEVVCIRSCPVAPIFTHEGERYLVERVEIVGGEPSLFFVGIPSGSPHWSFWIGRLEQAFYGYNPARFRKVQRRKTDLSLEAFFKVPGGYEEKDHFPVREPAKCV